MEAGACMGPVEYIQMMLILHVCVSVCRCHSTCPQQSVAGEITARSRPPCPSCPSLSVPVPPAACHGRARPWRMVQYSIFKYNHQHLRQCLSVLVLSSRLSLCVCVCAGYQLRASIYSYGPADSQPSPFTLDASIRSAEALSGKQTLSLHFFSLCATLCLQRSVRCDFSVAPDLFQAKNLLKKTIN